MFLGLIERKEKKITKTTLMDVYNYRLQRKQIIFLLLGFPFFFFFLQVLRTIDHRKNNLYFSIVNKPKAN